MYDLGFVISGIKLSPDVNDSRAISVVSDELKRAGINPARIRLKIFKRSVDARRKKDIKIVYSVLAEGEIDKSKIYSISSKYSISQCTRVDEISPKIGSERSSFKPLVVGMGPAGLFAALLLAENGYSPTIIDRGDCVKNRIQKNKNFIENGVLDTESNIQFGAGGAGTFSDGKLVTRINDKNISYIFNRFCEFGAPEEIKVSAKPHIGTDLLVGIVDRLLQRISDLGGTVCYRTKLEKICEMPDGSVKAVTNQGDISASCLVLAPGHSARDTYSMLFDSAYSVEPKPFSVGVRIEHLQKDIDVALYGDFAGSPFLGKGEYHLSDTTHNRGVYTFCMCPGGQVVAATSEENAVVVNGMSNNSRDGINSNAAVLVSVLPQDVGGTPQSAIQFQRTIEAAAFLAGGKDYFAPIQTVGDLLNGKRGTEPIDILPTYMNGKVRCAAVSDYLPKFVTDELKHGIMSFDKKINGFARPSAILTGVESRTSAPLRILRSNETFNAIGHPSVYPCGEGAGYAGGITSAAADGVKVALAIMERFAPN